jgi:hypothetical protein
MGAKFSGGGATVFHDRTDTPGEIVTELVNSTDGQGLHFDGAAGYVSCGDSTILDGATKMSMEAIVSTSATAAGLVIGKSHASECFYVRFDADGKLRATINNGSGNGTAVSASAYNDGDPKHIVITWDAATVSIYVNGNLDGTATLAGGSIPNTSDLLGLGAQLHGNGTSRASFFDGIIYRARLWNKSLSQPEVTASYENATVPFADQYGSQTELVVNGDFASATGWEDGAYVSIAGGKSSWTATTGGTYAYVRRADWTITKGKRYRLSFTPSSVTASGPLVLYQYDGTNAITGEITASGTDPIITEFTAAKSSSSGVLFGKAASTFVGDIEVVSCVEIGVVSDYDLAFANPTQSLMVQDRAGAADGTSSATGVVQVTPIEQLNSKSARIGTSAATPADGDLDVSGNVKIGSSLLIRGDNTASDPGMPYIRSDGNYLVINSDPDNGMYIQNDGSGNLSLCEGGGNVGIGGTPKASWISDLAVLQFGEVGALTGGDTAWGGYVELCANSYRDSGGFKRLTADYATLYEQNNANGSHNFKVAATGAADAAITWSTALTISSAGLSSFAPGTNTAGINVTTAGDPAYGVKIDSAGAGITNPSLWVYNNGASSGPLAFIEQDHTSGTGDVLKIQNDGSGRSIYVEGGGIVEQGGVLKSNLLTNSGFDVWSNSTLENVGSELVTNGTAWTGATGATKPNDWTQWAAATWTIDSSSGSGAEPALKVEHNGTNNNPAMHQIATTVVGKLYKISVKVKKGTASYAWLRLGTSAQGGQYNYWANSSGSWDTIEYVFEATTTTTYLSFEATTSTTGQYSHIDTASIYKVTPGCVAGSAGKGPDGWTKQASARDHLTRQHWDGDGGDSDATKTGSFYSMKITKASASGGGIHQIMPVGQYRGRTITFGCWVKTDATSFIRLYVDDGVSWPDYTGYHTGGDTWEWLEVTSAVDATAPSLKVFIETTGNDTEVAYISQVMAVLGSAIGSGNYSRPMGEIVWCEQSVPLNNYIGSTVSSNETINLESNSNGKIPKGAAGVNYSGSAYGVAYQWLTISPSTSGSYPVTDYLQLLNQYLSFGRFVGCDSSGDIAIRRNGTLSGVTIDILGVKLR